MVMTHTPVQYSYNVSHQPRTDISSNGVQSVSLANVPKNIRHKFRGTNFVELFSDPELVEDSWNRVARISSRYQNPHMDYRQRTPQSPTKFTADELPYGTVLLRDTYQDMSRLGRNNYFPGRNVTYRHSFGQHIHSAEVHNSADPRSEQNRKRKDDFGDYNEKVYIRHVMERVWQNMKAEKPQLVDWEALQASRPPLAKPMRPSLKKTEGTEPVAGEEPPPPPVDKRVTISESPVQEFKTPPLSPPKDSLYKANAAKQPAFVRDEEFWEFYDRPVNETNSKKS